MYLNLKFYMHCNSTKLRFESCLTKCHCGATVKIIAHKIICYMLQAVILLNFEVLMMAFQVYGMQGSKQPQCYNVTIFVPALNGRKKAKRCCRKGSFHS